MQTKQIPTEEALRYCSIEEGHFFDRKAAEIKGAKVQKIAVAFANADGGEFCIGVKDEKQEADPQKRWAGAEHIEDFNSHIQALSEVKPTLPVTFTFLRSPLSPNYVLKVEIEKSTSVHATTDKTVYERRGAASLPADPERITQISFEKGATSYEDYTVESGLAEDVVDSKEIASFLSYYSPSTDPLELAASKNLIDRKTFKPRVVGLLLFSDDPPSHVPKKCSVRIVRYETKEDDPERDQLVSNISVEGNIYNLIHKTVDQVKSIMSSVKVWTAQGPKAMEYPHETIWEIITNAIIHRDYSISDDVQIFIFNNRIEVVSPGRFPGFVTKDNFLDVHLARNHRIVNLLGKYKNPPNQDIGEGLNTAFRKMRDWKLQAPQVLEEGNYIRVIIPHASLATPQEAVMEFLDKHPQITNAQGREITGIRSENAMKSEFYKLRDAGIIEMVPGLKGNKAAWQKTGSEAQSDGTLFS
ncbi:putative DNA binding domain-containing protein [Luteolibacter sp. SL250]|uniref:RNA-binding domain-containing protein n=1 Tax=Luteolibacter sp. SL250 TaxID=2995170 RepID=UPI00226E52C1|nr:RNA-binding domain-containing protein [Luteolibacter sp. SL250]WAC18094.1 putative DNA binding domain-containing protein [Luteolibacter sp. SL250]